MPSDDEILWACKPYTETDWKRMRQVLWSVRRVVRRRVMGAFVEVGVWRGGCSMLTAKQLLRLGITDRHLYLFDTFAGSTAPGPEDVSVEGHIGYETHPEGSFACSIEEVQANMESTGYPADHIHLYQCDVRKMFAGIIPRKMALLRIDLDWYDLYFRALRIFEPSVRSGGIVTVDDYGFWIGCRQAVNEWLETHPRELRMVGETAAYWITP